VHTPVYDEPANVLIFVAAGDGGRDLFADGARVFVCGSLQNPVKMAALVGREASFAPAIAVGFGWERQQVDGRAVQFMLPSPDEPERFLPGVVWLGLSEPERRAVEEFELADGLRRGVAVAVRVGLRAIEATTFVKK
jgi:hypothetical protein